MRAASVRGFSVWIEKGAPVAACMASPIAMRTRGCISINQIIGSRGWRSRLQWVQYVFEASIAAIVGVWYLPILVLGAVLAE